MGYSPSGHKESDMTEATQQQHRGSNRGFSGGSVVKILPASAGDIRDTGSILGSRARWLTKCQKQGWASRPEFSVLSLGLQRTLGCLEEPRRL